MSDTSEVLERDQVEGGNAAEPVDVEDVKRTLAELRRERETLIKERDDERTRRLAVESNLDNERVARTTAEQERDGHAARVVSEAEQRYNAEREKVGAQIKAREQSLEVAEERYAQLLEAGEFKEAAKLQRQMAEAGGEIAQLRTQDRYLETNKERFVPKVPPATREQPRQQSGHRYAQFVQGDLAPGEEQWLDKRPQFQTDQNYREQVFAASNIAAKRYARGTPENLREIERILGENTQETREQPRQQTEQTEHETETGGTPRRTQQRQQISADLPASRRAAPGQEPVNSQQWKLTADEAEIADGLYGEPNSEWYIADQATRYKHYYDMKQKKLGRG